jgi:hypothetical protein
VCEMKDAIDTCETSERLRRWENEWMDGSPTCMRVC